MNRTSAKIRILYVIGTLDFGGAERQLIRLCLHLNKEVFDTQIVLLYGRTELLDTAYADVQPLKVTRLAHRRKYSIGRLFDLRRILKEWKPDIVHTFLPAGNFWGTLAGRLFGDAKIVASSRGIHRRRTGKHDFMDYLSFNFLCERVVVNSEAVRNNCIDILKVAADKTVIINNSVSSEQDSIRQDKDKRESDSGGSDRPVITTVARLDKLKDVGCLIEAAGILHRKGVRATFLIAGRGPLEEALKRQAAQTAAADRIRFLGHVGDIDSLLSQTDIFVLPTLSEGCSNAILEAMARALPIVSTSIEANTELLESGRSGLLVPPGDAHLFAEAVRRFIDDPAFARSCGMNARRKAAEYDVDTVVRQYESFYKGLLQG